MKRNWILLTLTGFLLAVVSLLTFHLHYQGIQEVLSQFQEDQLSRAKHLSNQIQFFIQARSRGLRALSSFPSIQYGDVKQQLRAREEEALFDESICLSNDEDNRARVSPLRNSPA